MNLDKGLDTAGREVYDRRMTTTHYSPEVTDQVARALQNIFGSMPYAGSIAFPYGRDGGPPGLGQLVDAFATFRDHLVTVANENTAIKDERDQLLADLRAVGRLAQKAGLA